jgi:hypothetical protein
MNNETKAVCELYCNLNRLKDDARSVAECLDAFIADGVKAYDNWDYLPRVLSGMKLTVAVMLDHAVDLRRECAEFRSGSETL